MLLRPEAINQVGGFDEAFFLYGEDTDLCARLLDRGWHVALAPTATAWHAIGASQAPGSTRWVDGLDAYLRRRGRTRLARTACFLFMAMGMAIRGLSPRAWRGADGRRMRSAAGRALEITFGR
jgi:GT2 family glycosyltransferase